MTGLAPSLSADQLRSYRDDGYVLLPGFFQTGQVDDILAEADALRAQSDLLDPLNLRCRFMPNVFTGEMLFEVFDPVIDISPACAAIARDERLLAALHSIYGEPASLFKDKLIYKPPGARGYPIHQDWISWPGLPRSFLTVLIALDEAGSGNGCTQLFAGIHRRGCLGPENGEFHAFTAADMGAAPKIELSLQPGDIAIFGGFTPHYSDPNHSCGDRRQLFLSFNALSDGGDLRQWHYQDFFRRRRQRLQTSSTDEYFFR